VINLSGDKDKVLKEAFRVLKPGGRFAVSDVVVRGDVPAAIRKSMELWVGCIAGALSEDAYRAKLAATGFNDIELEVTRVYGAEDARTFLVAEGMDVDAVAKDVDGKFVSAFIRATKPARSDARTRRFHVHLAVPDLEASVRFYSRLFGGEPAVLKPDYAKWMLDDPRVNFAISQRGSRTGLDHLGLQVESADGLATVRERFAAADAAAVVNEVGANCCYAKSDKHWVTDPQGIAWEAFHTLDTIPVHGGGVAEASGTSCCTPAAAPGEAGCCVSATQPPLAIAIVTKSCR
jgi:catechol 2,3-dioxygenase-like lactoylglutathione lyase family enzyme